MKIPNNLVQFSKELGIKLKTSQLESVSKAYNFPLKTNAIAKLEFEHTWQASEIIKFAKQHQYEIIPQSGNTNLVESATPIQPNTEPLTLLVSSSNIRHTHHVHSQEITTGAAQTIQNLQRIATTANLRFPLNYASKGSAQIGGAIATRAMGMGKGIPQVLSSVTIVDGKGEIHNLTYPIEPDIHNSVLPGLNTAWPLASQGYLGIITEATLKLYNPHTQRETLFIGTTSLEHYINIIEELAIQLKKSSLSTEIEYAEFMYAEAMANVFEEHKNPFQHTTHNLYGLLQIGTTELGIKGCLKDIIIDALSEKLHKHSSHTEIVIANSLTEEQRLLHLREAVSDAARLKCKLSNHIPIPFDISCSKKDFLPLLGLLDKETNPYKQHVFGHLKQGKGLFPIIHYNLGIPHSQKTDILKIENHVLSLLYQNFSHVSHSGEHGGLGSKNLDATTTYSDLNLLRQFESQLYSFNPYNTLQTHRTQQFHHLLNQRLNPT